MLYERANYKYKDALFKVVFGENPANALSLYNAINNSDYTNVDDLEITTLRDTVYIGIRNDVSFLFNHDMNLYEHQSTYCPNMPLRGLGYFADLMRQCKPMADHAEFVSRVRDYLKQGNSKEGAISAAIDDCIKEGILADILRGERDRVENILIRVLTEEKREHLYEMQLEREVAEKSEIARAEGRVEGITEGIAEGEAQIVRMNSYLLAQGRIDDLKRATEDEAFRKRILEEMVQ